MFHFYGNFYVFGLLIFILSHFYENLSHFYGTVFQ